MLILLSNIVLQSNLCIIANRLRIGMVGSARIFLSSSADVLKRALSKFSNNTIQFATTKSSKPGSTGVDIKRCSFIYYSSFCISDALRYARTSSRILCILRRIFFETLFSSSSSSSTDSSSSS